MNPINNLMKRGTIVLMFFTVLPFISLAKETKLKLHSNAKAMKREIARHLAMGSGIKAAHRIMTANGFKCILMERESFADEDNDGRVVTRKNMDFLRCDKEKGLWWPPLSGRRWQVIFVHDNGLVSYISVAISYTSP